MPPFQRQARHQRPPQAQGQAQRAPEQWLRRSQQPPQRQAQVWPLPSRLHPLQQLLAP